VTIRQANFALRVVRRRAGDAGILYRRTLTENQEERLTRIAAISPLAFSAGAGLLREAVREHGGKSTRLTYGPFHPLDPDWGARVACYSLVARGLRNANRLHRAADNLRHADGTEAAWWFGLMVNRSSGKRAVRALRILVEAVK
jgi:hypothetical protein